MDVLQISFVAPTAATSQKLASGAGAKVDSTSLPGGASFVSVDALCYIRASTPGNQNPNEPVVAPVAPAAVNVDGTDQALFPNNVYRVKHARKTILSFAGPAAFNVYITPEA